MSVVFKVIGFISLLAGVIALWGAMADNSAAYTVIGTMSIVSGFLFFGFGAIIEALTKIERYLRPASGDSPLPKIGLL